MIPEAKNNCIGTVQEKMAGGNIHVTVGKWAKRMPDNTVETTMKLSSLDTYPATGYTFHKTL